MFVCVRERHLEAALELVEAVLPAQFLGQVLDVQRRARRWPVLLEGFGFVRFQALVRV